MKSFFTDFKVEFDVLSEESRTVFTRSLTDFCRKRCDERLGDNLTKILQQKTKHVLNLHTLNNM